MSTRGPQLRQAEEDGAAIIAIHYACENLLELSGRAARVACIVTERVDIEEVRLFSYDDSADEPDVKERRLLESFFTYVSESEGASWVHWRMASAKFGFGALADRFINLGGEAVPVPGQNTYDVSQIIEELRGSPIEGNPKLFVMARLNGMLPHHALTGEVEARIFEEGQFAALDLSTEEKVKWIARMTRRLLANSLVLASEPVSPAVLWSSLREPFTALTFAQMKAVAGGAGLPVVELFRLSQGGDSISSKAALADAIDGLFQREPSAKQHEITQRLLEEIESRSKGEMLELIRRLRKQTSPEQGSEPPRPVSVGPRPPVGESPAKPPRVFVSHAGADSQLADLFVKEILRMGLSLSANEIFYTSGPATAVPAGSVWFATIEQELKDADVVLSLLTDSYLESLLCTLELGAAWITGKLLIVAFNDDWGPLGSLQLYRGGEPAKLDALAKDVSGRLASDFNVVTWNAGKDDFLEGLANALA